eukprot:PhF_6_TR4346/c0_g1_i1/m.5859
MITDVPVTLPPPGHCPFRMVNYKGLVFGDHIALGSHYINAEEHTHSYATHVEEMYNAFFSVHKNVPFSVVTQGYSFSTSDVIADLLRHRLAEREKFDIAWITVGNYDSVDASTTLKRKKPSPEEVVNETLEMCAELQSRHVNKVVFLTPIPFGPSNEEFEEYRAEQLEKKRKEDLAAHADVGDLPEARWLKMFLNDGRSTSEPHHVRRQACLRRNLKKAQSFRLQLLQQLKSAFPLPCSVACCCIANVNDFTLTPMSLPYRLDEKGAIILRKPPKRGKDFYMSLFADCMHLTPLGSEMMAYEVIRQSESFLPEANFKALDEAVVEYSSRNHKHDVGPTPEPPE